VFCHPWRGVLKADCRRCNGNETNNSLLFPNAVKELVKAIGHHHVHANEIVDGSEAAHREVPLDEVVLASSRPGASLEALTAGNRLDIFILCIGRADSPQRGAYPAALCRLVVDSGSGLTSSLAFKMPGSC
jgi:hypothetical protein